MEIKQGKKFYSPVGGPYIGTIIDVVDMPNVTKVFKGVTKTINQVRVLWVLAHLNGAAYLDPEGQPFTVVAFYNAVQTDNSNLTKMLTQVLNAVSPLITSSEQLSQILLGRSNSLYLTQTPDAQRPGEFFVNVAGISPLPAGVTPPQAPAGFVRSKDKPKTQAGPQGRPVQTYSQPPTQPTANSVTFTQNQNESF
jgi:hypothetical protein